MKNFKIIFCSLALLATAIAFSSCGSDEPQGKEYTSAYICPMHCEGSGSDTTGKCPVCGMDYVKNEKFKGENPAAGEDHEGHDHDDHEGHNH